MRVPASQERSSQAQFLRKPSLEPCAVFASCSCTSAAYVASHAPGHREGGILLSQPELISSAGELNAASVVSACAVSKAVLWTIHILPDVLDGVLTFSQGAVASCRVHDLAEGWESGQELSQKTW